MQVTLLSYRQMMSAKLILEHTLMVCVKLYILEHHVTLFLLT